MVHRFTWMRLTLLLVPSLTMVASAQVPYEGCTDRRGRPIIGVVSDSLSAPGWASIRADGTPVIYWNPKRQYTPQGVTQVFLYLHECAHHALGHVWQGGSLEERRADEQQADCWSYQLMVDGGMLTGNRREILEDDLSTMMGDAVHLPGDQMLRSLRNCLDARTNKRAWHAVLPQLEQAAADSFRPLRTGPLAEDPTVSEAAVQLPGTYDCEIRHNGSYVCLIFAARDDGRVDRRFNRIVDILKEWLSPSWTSNTVAGSQPGQRNVFMAERADTGTSIALLATVDRKIWFVMRPASR